MLREDMMREEKDTLLNRVREVLDYSGDYKEEEIRQIIARVVSDWSGEHYVSMQEKEQLSKAVFDSLRKLDILQELVDDPAVTEIMVNAYDRIFYEKDGKMILWDQHFESEEKLQEVIEHLVSECDRTVNESSPIVDGHIFGYRFCVVLSPPSLHGSTITIRKFPERNFSMEDFLREGLLTKEAAVFIENLVKRGYNLLIGGGTSSGKTTLLNSLVEFIPTSERIVTIEDSAELRIKKISNLVGLETRNSTVMGGKEINMRDLIKTALRLRPDRVIVGEVRGAECFDMLQILNTGHDGSLASAHANGTGDMLARLEAMVLMAVDIPPESVRMQILSGIDILIHLERMRNGKRRIVEISELKEIVDGRIVLNPLFTFKMDADGNGVLRQCGELYHHYKWDRYEEGEVK